MYKIDDLIIYGNTGACKIMDITTPENISTDKCQLYYVIKPLDQGFIIYTPVDTTMFMRPILSAEEVERLIDMIPTINADPYYNSRTNELTHHYEAILQSHNCADLIKLFLSIQIKKEIIEQQNRKLGQVDERFMKQVEELLHNEFALALNIPKDEVHDYIALRVEAINQKESQNKSASM